MHLGVSGRETAVSLILEALLNEPLNYEKIVRKFEGEVSRGTVNKYLALIVKDEMVEKVSSKIYGEKPYYQIVGSKRKEAEKIVEAYRKKLEFGPKFENLFLYATHEELKEIINFLFSTSIRQLELFYQPPYYPEKITGRAKSSYNAEKYVALFKSLSSPASIEKTLQRIQTRQKVSKLSQIGAPSKLIEIGNKKLNGKSLTDLEEEEFSWYPIDLEGAVTRVFFELSLMRAKELTNMKLQPIRVELELRDPEFGKILKNRFDEVLDSPVPEEFKKAFSANINRRKTESPEWLEFMKKNSKMFGKDLSKMLKDA